VIGVTGSNGVLGRALLTTLRELNIETVPIGRQNSAGNDLYSWDLEAPIPEEFLAFDLIINCAYSFKTARQEKFCEKNSNIEGSKKLGEWGKKNGKTIVNPSSVNAALTMTKYGFEKNYIEQIMTSLGHINLRLGILDDKPAIGLLENLLKRPKFMPRILIDADTEFFVSDLKKIAIFISSIYHKKVNLENSNFYVVNEVKETLPEILERLRPDEKCYFWNIKSYLALAILFPFRGILKRADIIYDQVLAVRKYDSVHSKNFEAEWEFIDKF
jgi:hypothetical protein